MIKRSEKNSKENKQKRSEQQRSEKNSKENKSIKRLSRFNENQYKAIQKLLIA